MDFPVSERYAFLSKMVEFSTIHAKSHDSSFRYSVFRQDGLRMRFLGGEGESGGYVLNDKRDGLPVF